MASKLIALTADIVAAHVSHNPVAPADLPALIASIHEALAQTSVPAEPAAVRPEPAVSVRASIKPDYLICLEDGKKLTMLKRHLRIAYNLTPEEYRAKWDLSRDYPMVAPNYAERRRTLARAIGLGRKGSKPTAPGTAAGTAGTADTVDAIIEPRIEKAKSGRKALGIFAARPTAAAHLGGDVASTENAAFDVPMTDTAEAS